MDKKQIEKNSEDQGRDSIQALMDSGDIVHAYVYNN